jgi:flagellar biosynthesis/type III secretory pathway M-ring protein FliF/YscJ
VRRWGGAGARGALVSGGRAPVGLACSRGRQGKEEEGRRREGKEKREKEKGKEKKKRGKKEKKGKEKGKENREKILEKIREIAKEDWERFRGVFRASAHFPGRR